MLLCTLKASVNTCKTIVYVIETLSDVVISMPIAMYKWFNKPCIRHTKKHHQTSNGSGKFSHNLCASKIFCYNKRNCKSGRHGCRHTFMKRKSRTKRATTNNLNQDLKIKGRKLGTFKSPPPSSPPPPRRLNYMIEAIHSWVNHQDINDIEHHSLPYNKPDLCNDYISMEQDKADRFPISFPRHCIFGHVLLDTNPHNNVDSWKEVV